MKSVIDTQSDLRKKDLYAVIDISHQASTVSSTSDIHIHTLKLIDRIIGSCSSVYVEVDENSRKALVSGSGGQHTAESVISEWIENYQDQDPFFQSCLTQSKTSLNYAVNSAEVMSYNKSKNVNSNFYNDFMRPHSFSHMLSIGLPSSSGGPISVISLQRSKNEKPFTSRDTLKANMVAPILGSLVERVSLNKQFQPNHDTDLISVNSNKSQLLLSARLQEFKLSRRESEIVCMVHKGLSNIDIANLLHLSVRTVSNHLYSIYEKTEVHNRTALLYRLTT